VLLKGCNNLLQLILRELPQVSLRQIGSTAPKRRIFFDQGPKLAQHLDLRFGHLFASGLPLNGLFTQLGLLIDFRLLRHYVPLGLRLGDLTPKSALPLQG